MTTLIRVPTVVCAATALAARATGATCSAASVDFAERHNFAGEYGESSPVVPVPSDSAFLTVTAEQRHVGRPRLRLRNVRLLAAIRAGFSFAASVARRPDAPWGVQLIGDQDQFVCRAVELVLDIDSMRHNDDSSFAELHQVLDEFGIQINAMPAECSWHGHHSQGGLPSEVILQLPIVSDDL